MENSEEKSQLNLDVKLEETTHKVEQFYHNNKQNIFRGLIGLVVLIGAYAGFKSFYLEPKEKEAQSAMFQAQNWFEKDSFAVALSGQGEAMGFEQIAENYGLTKAGNLAHYYAGVCCMKTGKFDAAVEHLESFSSDNALVGPIAAGLLGDAYVENGNLDKAGSQYMKAGNLNKNKITSPIFFKKAGMVFEETKEFKKAVDAYEKIKFDFTESQEASDIDKYIARASAAASN